MPINIVVNKELEISPTPQKLPSLVCTRPGAAMWSLLWLLSFDAVDGMYRGVLIEGGEMGKPVNHQHHITWAQDFVERFYILFDGQVTLSNK